MTIVYNYIGTKNELLHEQCYQARPDPDQIEIKVLKVSKDKEKQKHKKHNKLDM